MARAAYEVFEIMTMVAFLSAIAIIAGVLCRVL